MEGRASVGVDAVRAVGIERCEERGTGDAERDKDKRVDGAGQRAVRVCKWNGNGICKKYG